MPYLFSLGVRSAMASVSGRLEPGEHLFAFLDDVYVVSEPERTGTIYALLARDFHEKAGIRLHQGKARVWNAAGMIPDGIQDLGPEVWSPEGLMVLGTPMGSDAFASAKISERIAEESPVGHSSWNQRSKMCVADSAAERGSPVQLLYPDVDAFEKRRVRHCP